MKAIADANTQAASTMRLRGPVISRPSSRGHSSASMMPRLHGSTNGCAMTFAPHAGWLDENTPSSVQFRSLRNMHQYSAAMWAASIGRAERLG